MKPNRTLLAIAILGVALAAADQTLQAQAGQPTPDARMGTWTVNLAKSTYDPGPAPKMETRVYAPYGNGGVSAAMSAIGADGKPAKRAYRARRCTM